MNRQLRVKVEEVIDDGRDTIGTEFLDSIRDCVTAGMTPDQVGCVVALLISTHRLLRQFDEGSEKSKGLVNRAKAIARVMHDDSNLVIE